MLADRDSLLDQKEEILGDGGGKTVSAKDANNLGAYNNRKGGE
jgi:hypothetical protein